MLPSIARYLESLPDGESSYPECTVKASVLRSNVEERPLGPDVALPPRTRALVDDPPPVSVWLPEVQFNCTMLAVRDTHFGPGDVGGYLDWVYERNRRFFRTPLYRALFVVLSPERLLRGWQERWSSFRRGTEVQLLQQGHGDVEGRIFAPPHHYPELVALGLAQALRAAVTCAGAKDARADAAQISPTETAVRLRWR